MPYRRLTHNLPQQIIIILLVPVLFVFFCSSDYWILQLKSLTTCLRNLILETKFLVRRKKKFINQCNFLNSERLNYQYGNSTDRNNVGILEQCIYRYTCVIYRWKIVLWTIVSMHVIGCLRSLDVLFNIKNFILRSKNIIYIF